MQQRPTRVYLGVQVFDIQFRERDKDGMLTDSTLGYTLDQQSLIVIDSTLSISKQRVTLFHEIMHATYMVFGNVIGHPNSKAATDVWEHHFIGVWENSLLMVLTDSRNKDVASWVLDTSEPKKKK